MIAGSILMARRAGTQVATSAAAIRMADVMSYLGRNIHRMAISNHRLLDFDGDRLISVEGLRAREPVVDNDAVGDGVAPPRRPARHPARFRSHQAVRVSGEHLSRGPRLATPAAAVASTDEQ